MSVPYNPRKIGKSSFDVEIGQHLSYGRLWDVWSGWLVTSDPEAHDFTLRDRMSDSSFTYAPPSASLGPYLRPDSAMTTHSDLRSGYTGSTRLTGSTSSTLLDSSLAASTTLVNDGSPNRSIKVIRTPVVLKFACPARSTLSEEVEHARYPFGLGLTDSDVASRYSEKEAEEAIYNEIDLYDNALKDLQGAVVPQCYGLWTGIDGSGEIEEKVFVMILDRLVPLEHDAEEATNLHYSTKYVFVSSLCPFDPRMKGLRHDA